VAKLYTLPVEISPLDIKRAQTVTEDIRQAHPTVNRVIFSPTVSSIKEAFDRQSILGPNIYIFRATVTKKLDHNVIL